MSRSPRMKFSCKGHELLDPDSRALEHDPVRGTTHRVLAGLAAQDGTARRREHHLRDQGTNI